MKSLIYIYIYKSVQYQFFLWFVSSLWRYTFTNSTKQLKWYHCYIDKEKCFTTLGCSVAILRILYYYTFFIFHFSFFILVSSYSISIISTFQPFNVPHSMSLCYLKQIWSHLLLHSSYRLSILQITIIITFVFLFSFLYCSIVISLVNTVISAIWNVICFEWFLSL